MVSVKHESSKAPKLKKAPKVEKIEKKKKTKPAKDVPSKVLLSEENHIKKTPEAVVNEGKVSKRKKKSKYVMPSKAVTEELVTSVLNALHQLTVHHKQKNTLFDEECSIMVDLHCIKIPTSKGKVKFVLPHSIVPSTGEVCLVTPDIKKGKKIDHEPTLEHWEELLRNAGVTSVKTILPMRQLKVEYDQYEMKRRLATQHDLVLVDTKILNPVAHFLGKIFFKKPNMLIPVRIKGVNLKKEIDVGLRSSMLRFNEGDNSSVVVGHTGMAQEEVKDNIMSLIEQLKDRYPGGQANIRQISLRVHYSVKLPLYLTLRPSNTVGVPKMNRQKPKHFTTVEDELSTIPGSTVRVAPDGTVHVKKGKHIDLSDMEEDDAEEQEESNNEESDKEEE